VRLAWTLHGLPDPLPADEYAACLAAVASTYSTGAVVAGLRLAASIMPAHGSGVSPSRLAALAGEFARRQAVAA